MTGKLFFQTYLEKMSTELSEETIKSYFLPNFNKALQSSVDSNDFTSCKIILNARAVEFPKVLPESEVTWHDTETEEFFVNCLPLVKSDIENLCTFVEAGVRPKDLSKIIEKIKAEMSHEDLESLASHFSALDLYDLADRVSANLE